MMAFGCLRNSYSEAIERVWRLLRYWTESWTKWLFVVVCGVVVFVLEEDGEEEAGLERAQE